MVHCFYSGTRTAQVNKLDDFGFAAKEHGAQEYDIFDIRNDSEDDFYLEIGKENTVRLFCFLPS